MVYEKTCCKCERFDQCPIGDLNCTFSAIIIADSVLDEWFIVLEDDV